MTKEDAQEQLIGLVRAEITTNEREQWWFTDKVAFNMRELIKHNRKNYWGVYDEPIDPVTGQDKIWVPLTRLLVDSVRKNADLDTKDIRFRAKDDKGYALTDVVRGYVREWLSNIYLDHQLNQSIFTTAIDGTDVWKTTKTKDGIKRKDVDILNVYIDPGAESIQEAYRFTERALMTPTEVRSMDWENVEGVEGKKNLEGEDGNSALKNGTFVDVYECWGKFPRKLIKAANGQDHDEDDLEEIDAQVVISGIDTNDVRFHYTEQNTNKDKNGDIIKPYEESWYIKVPGRWYGVGIPEIVMQLQEWVNMVVNLRHKKNTIAQLGLLKIRKGQGITQQMLSRLVSNGVIELTDPTNDLQQLDIRESGEASYKDEEVAKQWAQEVTSVFDINIGELPASTSATGAVIQNQQQNSAFQLITESYEHFIKRWIDRHVLPEVPKMIKKDKKARIYGDFDNIKQIRERVIAHMAMEKLEEMLERGIVPTEPEVMATMADAEQKLARNGDMFMDVVDEIIANSLDTEVFMTNAEIDVGTTVRNLLELRNGVDPQTAANMTAQALDLLGMQVPSSLSQSAQTQPQQQITPDLIGNPQQQFAETNTIGNEQR